MKYLGASFLRITLVGFFFFPSFVFSKANNCVVGIFEAQLMRNLVPSMSLKNNRNFMDAMKSKDFDLHPIPWKYKSFEADENDMKRVLIEEFGAGIWMIMDILPVDSSGKEVEGDDPDGGGDSPANLKENSDHENSVQAKPNYISVVLELREAESDRLIARVKSAPIDAFAGNEFNSGREKFLNELAKIKGPGAFQFLTYEKYFLMEAAGNRYMQSFLKLVDSIPGCLELK